MTVLLRSAAEMSIVSSSSQPCWRMCADRHMLLHRNSPHGTRPHHPASEGTLGVTASATQCPGAWPLMWLRFWHTHVPHSLVATGSQSPWNVPVVTGTHTVTKQAFNLTVFLRREQEESRVNSWSAYPNTPRSVSTWLLFIALMELALTEAAVSRSTLTKAVINVQSCTSTGQG